MSGAGYGLIEMGRRQTKDAVKTAREASARPGAARRGPHISPFYARYLNDQAALIRANGGTDADVEQFARLEMNNMMQAMPRVSLEDELAQADMPTNLQGFSRAMLNGATFGFGEEAVGAMYGKLTGLGARAGIDAYRAEYDAWAEENGKKKFAAELLGGVLTGGVGGAGKTVTGTALRAGAAGALAGAGNAEGGIPERLRSAMWGAGIGTVGGAAISGAVRAAAPIARTLTPRVIQRIVGETPEERAGSWLYQTLVADGVDEATAIASVRDFARTGSPASILEIGGEKTLALARGVFKNNSPLTQALLYDLKEREETQANRIFARMLAPILQRNRLGTANARDLKRMLHTEKLRASAPYYENAHEQVATVTPEMRRLLKHPIIRKMWKEGMEEAEKEDLGGVGHGLKVPALPGEDTISLETIMAANPGLSRDKAALIAKTIGREEVTALPVRGFDMMKRRLDRLINAEKAAGENTRGLEGMRHQLIHSVREEIGSYDRALMEYGGFADAEDIVDKGMTFLRMAPEDIAEEMRMMTPTQKDFFRIGAIQALYEKVFASGNAPKDAATKYFGGELLRGTNPQSMQARRLLALYPDAPDAGQDLLRMIAGEARISHSTHRAVRLPATITPEKLEQAAEGSIMQARGTLGTTVLSAARQQVVRSRAQLAQEEADELTHLFGQGLTDPTELETLIRDLYHHGRRAERVRAANVRGRVQATLGQAGGRAAAAIQP